MIYRETISWSKGRVNTKVESLWLRSAIDTFVTFSCGRMDSRDEPRREKIISRITEGVENNHEVGIEEGTILEAEDRPGTPQQPTRGVVALIRLQHSCKDHTGDIVHVNWQ